MTVRGDLANERRKVKEIFSICCNWEQEPKGRSTIRERSRGIRKSMDRRMRLSIEGIK